MALMDLLNSLINPQPQGNSGGGGALSFGQTAGAINPGQSTAPGGQTTTPVSELVVNAKRRQQNPQPSPQGLPAPDTSQVSSPFSPAVSPAQPPTGVDQSTQPAGMDYNNSGAASAVNSAIQGEHPEGGMANPGIYGLLPSNLQHGTLRNVLGALGDALLVSGGRQPQYEARMQNQEIGQAMAGMDINDPQSVAAATQRVAATGATGSPEMADKLQTQAESAALRKQYMEYNQDYRNGILNARQEQIDANRANIADRYRPQIGGMFAGVKDAATYATKYASLAPLAKQIGGPEATPASLWSIPEPGNWTPDLMTGYGMTVNNDQQASDRAAGRATSTINAGIAAGSREGAAGISGRAHLGAASMEAAKPTEGTIMSGLISKQNAGQTLSPSEQAYFNSKTQIRSGARSLPPGLTVGGAKPAATTSFVNGRVYTDARGNHATYQNGKWIPHN